MPHVPHRASSKGALCLKNISNHQLDYLAAIYQASQALPDEAGGFVASSDLADHMLTTQSTANRMIERLRDIGLIEHQRYVGVRLTPDGLAAAAPILRRQAIIACFLQRVMGLPWAEIDPEAQRIRHSISERVLERMWQMAGQPSHGPFGDWIDPPANAPADLRLSDAETGRDYRLARVLTRHPDRLDYLDALGLKPGVALTLTHRAPFDGPLRVQIAAEHRIIGHSLALMLTVTPLHDEAAAAEVNRC